MSEALGLPRIIPRERAVAEITAARGASPCLVCALRDGVAGPRHVLAAGARTTVLLPHYAVRWGHTLILINEHVTRFEELSAETWQEATGLVLCAARALERALRPARCYVASLGAASDDLPMTSPHLHLHVIPIYQAEDKPSAVLTWDRGVTVADEEEWAELHRILLAAWEPRPH